MRDLVKKGPYSRISSKNILPEPPGTVILLLVPIPIIAGSGIVGNCAFVPGITVSVCQSIDFYCSC